MTRCEGREGAADEGEKAGIRRRSNVSTVTLLSAESGGRAGRGRGTNGEDEEDEGEACEYRFVDVDEDREPCLRYGAGQQEQEEQESRRAIESNSRGKKKARGWSNLSRHAFHACCSARRFDTKCTLATSGYPLESEPAANSKGGKNPLQCSPLSNGNGPYERRRVATEVHSKCVSGSENFVLDSKGEEEVVASLPPLLFDSTLVERKHCNTRADSPTTPALYSHPPTPYSTPFGTSTRRSLSLTSLPSRSSNNPHRPIAMPIKRSAEERQLPPLARGRSVPRSSFVAPQTRVC